MEALREIAHDVLTSYEAGRANQQIDDHDVLAYATEEGYYRGQALIVDIQGKSGEASRETRVESRGQLKK